MRIDHRVVVYDGERLGDLISCGPRFRFFTTHAALSPLDGRAFGGQAEVVAAALPLLAAHRRPAGAEAASGSRKIDLDGRAAVPVDAVPRPHGHRPDIVRNRDAA